MIRVATIDDLSAVFRIYSCRYESGDAETMKYSLDDWSWYLTSPNAVLLVYESDGEVVAFSFTYDMGIWGYMEHIVVDEPHRYHGYARSLVERTMDIGRERGWRLLEACYYAEMGQMKTFFEKLDWQDGGINTRWVFLEP